MLFFPVGEAMQLRKASFHLACHCKKAEIFVILGDCPSLAVAGGRAAAQSRCENHL